MEKLRQYLARWVDPETGLTRTMRLNAATEEKVREQLHGEEKHDLHVRDCGLAHVSSRPSFSHLP